MKIEDGKPQNDPLDAMLAKAKWPEPPLQSTHRLKEFWKDQWNSRHLRANWLWPMAAAAAIIVGLGSVIVLVLMPPRINMPGGFVLVPQPPPKIKPQPVMMESRPPTMRELMLVGEMRPKKRLATTLPVVPQ